MEQDFNKPMFEKQEQSKAIKETIKSPAKPKSKSPSLNLPSLGDLQFGDNPTGKILTKIRNWMPIVLIGFIAILAIWAIFKEVIKNWF